jgi:hypothetical protein
MLGIQEGKQAFYDYNIVNGWPLPNGISKVDFFRIG